MDGGTWLLRKRSHQRRLGNLPRPHAYRDRGCGSAAHDHLHAATTRPKDQGCGVQKGFACSYDVSTTCVQKATTRVQKGPEGRWQLRRVQKDQGEGLRAARVTGDTEATRLPACDSRHADVAARALPASTNDWMCTVYLHARKCRSARNGKERARAHSNDTRRV